MSIGISRVLSISVAAMLGVFCAFVAAKDDATDLFSERFGELLPLASEITMQHRPSTDVISYILANPADNYWIHKVIVDCSHRVSAPCDYLSDILKEIVRRSDFHAQGCKKFPSSFVRLLDHQGGALLELLFDHSGKCFTVANRSYLSQVEFDPRATQLELAELARTDM